MKQKQQGIQARRDFRPHETTFRNVMMLAVCTTVDLAICVAQSRVKWIARPVIVRLESLFRTVSFYAGPINAVVLELTGALERNWLDIFSPLENNKTKYETELSQKRSDLKFLMAGTSG